MDNGPLWLSQTAGLGVTLNREALERFRREADIVTESIEKRRVSVRVLA